MDFKTAYGIYQKCYTSSGSDILPDFGYVKEQVDDFDNEGNKVGSHESIVFKKIGEHSIQEQINSYEDSTDIKKLFLRYQAGDTSVLEKRIGEYVDSVGCPDNLLDAQLALKNGELLWNQFPADMKAKYDNDMEKFITAAVNGELSKDLADSQKAVAHVQAQQADEIAELKKQIAEMQKGVKYE